MLSRGRSDTVALYYWGYASANSKINRSEPAMVAARIRKHSGSPIAERQLCSARRPDLQTS